MGNFIGAYVVPKVHASTFFFILTSICLASVFVYIPLAKPEKANSDTNKCAESVEDDKISETWELAKSARMMVFMPILAQSGVIVATRAALFVQLFTFTMAETSTSPSTQNSQILLSMLGIGFGMMTGTLLNGQLRDKFGTRQVIYVNMLQHLLAYGVIMRYLSHGIFSLPFAMAVTFFWGMLEGGINNFIYCVCGF